MIQRPGSDEYAAFYAGYIGRVPGGANLMDLLAGQAELRYRYNNRFGAVVFAGTGQVFDNGDFSMKSFKPSFGAGGRYFFDPEKGLSVRMDYAVGEKRTNEKRQSGFYITLAEAF